MATGVQSDAGELIKMSVKQVIQESGKPVKVWTDEIESGARVQLANLSTLPFIHHHVAAMPDVHRGMGATISSLLLPARRSSLLLWVWISAVVCAQFRRL